MVLLISNAAEEREIQLIFLQWIATYTRKAKGEYCRVQGTLKNSLQPRCTKPRYISISRQSVHGSVFRFFVLISFPIPAEKAGSLAVYTYSLIVLVV